MGCSIGDSLVTPGNVEFTGDAMIHGDATIGGNLTGAGDVEVDGQLELGGTSQLIGSDTIASQVPYQSPGTTPPCACDPSTFFDVAGAVAAARTAANAQNSWTNVGHTQLHLSTGNYYVTSSAVVGSTAIVIDGNVSVFVDGNLAQVGATQWQISSGAQLDLYVAGNVESVGKLTAGNASAPDAFRLYIGGSGTTSLGAVGQSDFYGALYAPTADVSYVGDTHVVGSIFAKSIIGVGALTINYGDATMPPESCTPPGDGGSGTGNGSGIIL